MISLVDPHSLESIQTFSTLFFIEKPWLFMKKFGENFKNYLFLISFQNKVDDFWIIRNRFSNFSHQTSHFSSISFFEIHSFLRKSFIIWIKKYHLPWDFLMKIFRFFTFQIFIRFTLRLWKKRWLFLLDPKGYPFTQNQLFLIILIKIETYLRVFLFSKITFKRHFLTRKSQIFTPSFSHKFSSSSSSKSLSFKQVSSKFIGICTLIFKYFSNIILPFHLFVLIFNNQLFLSSFQFPSNLHLIFHFLWFNYQILLSFSWFSWILFHSLNHTIYLVNFIFLQKISSFFIQIEHVFQPILHQIFQLKMTNLIRQNSFFH